MNEKRAGATRPARFFITFNGYGARAPVISAHCLIGATNDPQFSDAAVIEILTATLVRGAQEQAWVMRQL